MAGEERFALSIFVLFEFSLKTSQTEAGGSGRGRDGAEEELRLPDVSSAELCCVKLSPDIPKLSESVAPANVDKL